MHEDRQCQVDDTLDGAKLYTACRKFFPMLSKSQLRDSLKAGAISVNSRVMDIRDDTRKVNEGDVVRLNADRQTEAMKAKLLRGHGSDIPIHYISDYFAVVEKEAGVGCHPTSDFYLRLKHLLWNGEAIEIEKLKAAQNERVGAFEGHQLLYNPGKAASGLLVIVRNCESMLYVRSLLQAEQMKIVYSCIVCGHVGEEGSEITMGCDNYNCDSNSTRTSADGSNTNDNDNDDNDNDNRDSKKDNIDNDSNSKNEGLRLHLRVKIVKICRSRAAGYVSYLQVTPIFKLPCNDVYTSFSNEEKTLIFTRPSCRQDYDHILFPSKIIKSIREYFLSKAHPIIGENNVVKKTKGIFVSISQVCFANKEGHDSHDITIEVPTKFTTLLKTEEELWKIWNEKNQLLLSQSNDNSIISQESIQLLREGYPVQYISERAQFYGYEFVVNKSVMIPRKSSEVLVKAAVEFIVQLENTSHHDVEYVYTLLDLGTGSGSLLLSSILELKKKGIKVKGVGIDASTEALAIAQRNAELHSLTDDEITFEQGDFETIDHSVFGVGKEKSNIDVILCNPPYSSVSEIHRLSTSNVMYEPHTALFCSNGTGPTGNYKVISNSLLRVVGNIERSSLNARYNISDENRCIFEIGHGQENDVKGIFMKKKTSEVEGRFHLMTSLRDHNDIVRCLVYKIDNKTS